MDKNDLFPIQQLFPTGSPQEEIINNWHHRRDDFPDQNEINAP